MGAILGGMLGAATGTYACTLELDDAIACGDGFVDTQAGEECDPLDRDSFIFACAVTNRPNGDGACDPTTCTIINDRDQCAACGDGFIDTGSGETCDGDNLGGQRCPGGEDAVQCTPGCALDFSLCDLCGDGEIDVAAGEECDKADVGGLAMQRPCAGADIGGPGEISPLQPPNANIPYTHGVTASCNDDCLFSRLGCSYCGNGRRDPPTRIDAAGNLTAQEICDGDIFDLAHLTNEFPNSACWESESQPIPGLQPNVACAGDCLGYESREDEAACCIQSGANCPLMGATLRCCYDFAHPGEAPCEANIDGQGQTLEVCK